MALEPGHRLGPYRDIKPENLFLLNDGRVKILDFGLARQDPLLAGTADLSSSPTAARPTNPGAMIGTVGYLAPKQARGEVAVGPSPGKPR